MPNETVDDMVNAHLKNVIAVLSDKLKRLKIESIIHAFIVGSDKDDIGLVLQTAHFRGSLKAGIFRQNDIQECDIKRRLPLRLYKIFCGCVTGIAAFQSMRYKLLSDNSMHLFQYGQFIVYNSNLYHIACSFLC